MAKKYNRSRPQKRNIDRRKLEKYREEITRELGVDLGARRSVEERTGKKATTGMNLNRYRNPLT